MKIQIAPSLLAADFSALGDDCGRMEQAGADLLHVDVMDGHFVPNLTLGPALTASLRKRLTLPFDVHLMVERPAEFAEPFLKAGADVLLFHTEALSDIRGTLDVIRRYGRKAGLVVKPKTPAEAVFPYLKEIDTVMVMTVEPGFGGQKLIPETLSKITEVRREAARQGLPDLNIEVDGGINLQTAPAVVRAGANVLVAGSSLFHSGDYAAAVRELREAAQAAAPAD